jgi:hypothetical protein
MQNCNQLQVFSNISKRIYRTDSGLYLATTEICITETDLVLTKKFSGTEIRLSSLVKTACAVEMLACTDT